MRSLQRAPQMHPQNTVVSRSGHAEARLQALQPDESAVASRSQREGQQLDSLEHHSATVIPLNLPLVEDQGQPLGWSGTAICAGHFIHRFRPASRTATWIPLMTRSISFGASLSARAARRTSSSEVVPPMPLIHALKFLLSPRLAQLDALHVIDPTIWL